jgi:hypothetical protein
MSAPRSIPHTQREQKNTIVFNKLTDEKIKYIFRDLPDYKWLLRESSTQPGMLVLTFRNSFYNSESIFDKEDTQHKDKKYDHVRLCRPVANEEWAIANTKAQCRAIGEIKYVTADNIFNNNFSSFTKVIEKILKVHGYTMQDGISPIFYTQTNLPQTFAGTTPPSTNDLILQSDVPTQELTEPLSPVVATPTPKAKKRRHSAVSAPQTPEPAENAKKKANTSHSTIFTFNPNSIRTTDAELVQRNERFIDSPIAPGAIQAKFDTNFVTPPSTTTSRRSPRFFNKTPPASTSNKTTTPTVLVSRKLTP